MPQMMDKESRTLAINAICNSNFKKCSQIIEINYMSFNIDSFFAAAAATAAAVRFWFGEWQRHSFIVR